MNAARDSARARLHMVIRGRVQGVGFRAAVAEEANSLGLDGWVRNLPDGTVELLAEGARGTLEMLFAWARSGPPLARVEGVGAQWEPDGQELRGFKVR